MHRSTAVLVLLLLTQPLFAQPGGDEGTVSVYVSLDFEHASAILDLFTKETGIRVEPSSDTEDNKTVGLVTKIIGEGDRPLADVFWNNECAQSERLRALGRLEPYAPPTAGKIPAGFKD